MPSSTKNVGYSDLHLNSGQVTTNGDLNSEPFNDQTDPLDLKMATKNQTK